MIMEVRKNHKPLLQAIDEFRNWGARPWTLEWDTLMYYWEDDCIQSATQELYDKGYTDEEIEQLQWTPKWYDLFEEYLMMYLCN